MPEPDSVPMVLVVTAEAEVTHAEPADAGEQTKEKS